jgi:hypothetical protein
MPPGAGSLACWVETKETYVGWPANADKVAAREQPSDGRGGKVTVVFVEDVNAGIVGAGGAAQP